MSNSILEAIKFKKLSPEDSKKYRAIRLESLQEYPHHFGSTYQEQKQKEKLFFEGLIETSHSECFVIGAFLNNTLIGICAFYKFSDERYKHRGEILQMYVQPKYQHHKVGFNLLQAAIKEAFKTTHLEQIELEVITSAKSANQIYEKVDFQECGRLRKFLKHDAVYYDKRSMVLHRAS